MPRSKPGNKKLIDLRGMKFGRWLVLNRGQNTKHGFPRWLCECECGRRKEISGSDLRHRKSNGCRFCGNADQRTMEERIADFMAKFKKVNSGCWEWITDNPRKYPTTDVVGKKEHIHRAMWIIVNDEIPDGILVRHSCDNAMCGNPAHLSLGTYQDNADDKVKRGRQIKGEKQSEVVRKQWHTNRRRVV